MELYPINETSTLFISPTIDDWSAIDRHTIHAVFNLDADLDQNIPRTLNQTLYIYFPIEDQYLPDVEQLYALARLGSSLIDDGHQILCHCGMGHNRSALLAGLVLICQGFSGKEAVLLIRSKREGALYNKNFADFLESIPQPGISAL